MTFICHLYWEGATPNIYIYTLCRECTTWLYQATAFGLFAKPVPAVNGFSLSHRSGVFPEQQEASNHPPKHLQLPFQCSPPCGGEFGVGGGSRKLHVHSLHVYVPPCWRIHTLCRECTTWLYQATAFGLFAKPVPAVNGFSLSHRSGVFPEQQEASNHPPKHLQLPFQCSPPFTRSYLAYSARKFVAHAE